MIVASPRSVTGESWDERLPPDVDPHLSWASVNALRLVDRGVPRLLEVRQGGTTVAVHVLRDIRTEQGTTIARTPSHGGPWLLNDDVRPTDVRDAIDAANADADVASEVVQLSPWCPRMDEVVRAWDASAAIPICVHRVNGSNLELGTLSKGRRSDIKRSQRLHRWTFDELDASAAEWFGNLYDASMERADVIDRWLRPDGYFAELASGSTRRHQAWIATAQDRDGGASAIFMVGPVRAAYLYASRWGQPNGAPSRVVWDAMVELAGRGVTDIVLGGGTSDRADDPLFRFKRSLATDTPQHWIAARVHDQHAHDAAVKIGTARPLPPHAVVIDAADRQS